MEDEKTLIERLNERKDLFEEALKGDLSPGIRQSFENELRKVKKELSELSQPAKRRDDYIYEIESIINKEGVFLDFMKKYNLSLITFIISNDKLVLQQSEVVVKSPNVHSGTKKGRYIIVNGKRYESATSAVRELGLYTSPVNYDSAYNKLRNAGYIVITDRQDKAGRK
jgi:hypothetical protein